MGTCKTPLPSHIEQATEKKIFSFTSFNIVQLLWQIWMFKTKITFLKIQWSISTFCPTVFKNSPKCPNDDQMFGKTVNLTNEFRRTMPNDLVILWSKFIKSLHLPGLNFQNSCWHMKIDRINRCFADFSSSLHPLENCWAFEWKKEKKRGFSKDFSKLHPISWFFFAFSNRSNPQLHI